ncbi:LysR family transcriptional regulator [Arthrobacter sp.]|uniref:LysR family transcriptional regulator n=1 Tax=Arthrobacter sp. TaxID=1667 RepID=UPI003A8DABCC
MPRYTLRQLECFVAVAERGSIAAGAASLHLSASAVAGAVNELERIFGAQLTVRRKAHGVAMTPSGSYVLDRARGLLHSAEDLSLHAADAGGELRGTLMLGCYMTLAPTVLARLIDEYSRRYPLVDLDFFDGSQQEVQERLLSGRIDLAIAYDVSLPPGLERLGLFDVTPSLVLAAGHPLADRQEISLAELADEPMILLDVKPSRENTMMMYASAGIQPSIRFRTTDYEATRSLVARGMGYAVLVQQPASAQSYEGRELVVRPIRQDISSVNVSLVWPAAVQSSQCARAMVELAAELYADGVGAS